MDDRHARKQRLDARLDEWRAEIDRLEAKSRVAGAEARIECEKQVRALRSRHERARDEMEALGRASGDAWNDVVRGLERATEDLGRSVRSALSRFD